MSQLNKNLSCNKPKLNRKSKEVTLNAFTQCTKHMKIQSRDDS